MDRRTAGNLQHTDLYIYQCGSEACEPGHTYGPAVRDHFLIHYIHNGKGTFEVGEKTYYLDAGCGFLICPGIVTTYRADDKEPWHYSWIGFHGLQAERYLKDVNLSLENPIFEYKKDKYKKDNFIDRCFYEMADAYYLKRGSDIRRFTYLYLFLDKLSEMNTQELYFDSAEDKHDAYITLALQYIEMNYMRKITVQDISNYIHLNRSYLNDIFKKSMGHTIQDYLVEFRLRKACELLTHTDLPISNIAHSVGYTDSLLFSKMFSKNLGSCPSQYRRDLTNTKNSTITEN